MMENSSSGNWRHVWEEGSCVSNPRKAKLRSLEEALEIFGSAIAVAISDISRGWDGVLQS